MTARRARRGFTLVELIVVMWFLGVMLVSGTVILVVTFRLERLAAGTIQRVSRFSQLADAFRDDVAAATAAPQRHGDRTRGRDCLILAQPGDVWVVYEWRNGKLWRRLLSAGPEQRREVATGPGDVAVEFDPAGGDGRLITLRLAEVDPERPKLTWEFSAALGGDRR
jgi:type II secretory pathway component PulJ